MQGVVRPFEHKPPRWPVCVYGLKCGGVFQVDEDGVKMAKKRRVSGGYKRGRYVVRSVDEITQEDLNNIAFRAKDKIWDKDHVSRRCSNHPFHPFYFETSRFQNKSPHLELLCIIDQVICLPMCGLVQGDGLVFYWTCIQLVVQSVSVCHLVVEGPADQCVLVRVVSRAVPVTSVDRRPWTLRRCVAAGPAWGSKVISVGHV